MPETTKVLMVWPAVPGRQLHGFLPLGLGSLAANLPEGCEARLWDGVLAPGPNARVAEEVTRFAPDVVALSVWHFNLPGARDVVAAIRERFPGLLIVVGGPTVCGARERVFEVIEADYAFVGEGEKPFARFVELLREGRLDDEAKRSLPGLCFHHDGAVVVNPPRWVPLEELEPCDYEFIRLGEYLDRGYRYGVHPGARRTAPLMTTRGCPYGCRYCSACLINGTRVRKRPVEGVLREIVRLRERFGIDGFNIIDDNFTFDLDYAKALCRGIISLGLRGVSFCAPNGVRVDRLDAELLELMREAGWHAVFVAPESASPSTLARMRKHLDPATVSEKVALIKKAGLRVFGFFMLGYPGETPDDFRQTISFAVHTPFDWATFTCFQPLAGTPVAEDLLAAGEIEQLPQGADYYRVVYAPEGLTVRRMRLWRLWAFFRFYTSSWRRAVGALRAFSLRRLLLFVLKLR